MLQSCGNRYHCVIGNRSQSIPNYQIGMHMEDNEIEVKNNDSESGTEDD